jgi:hypothetical protein
MDIQRLIQVAKGARHKLYSTHVQRAILYRMLSLGDGLDSMLKQFAKRESEALFKQRVEQTQHVVTAVIDSIMQPFQKVPRSKYQRTLLIEAKADSTKKLEQVIGSFFGNESLEEYLAERLLALNTIDPNAFIVVELDSFDARTGQIAQPYPFEAYSENCVDYDYDNSKLQYLIVCTDIDLVDDNGEPFVGKKYTLYKKDRVYILQQTTERVYANDRDFTLHEDRSFILIGKDTFELIEAVPYNLGSVPAIQVGYKRDKRTSKHSFVAPYDAAIPYLKKTIKTNSELDLTMANSAFPLTIRYANPCAAQGCSDGTLPDGKTCKVCAGTGIKQRPTSAMEEIEVALPSRKEDMVDLNNLIVFKSPPVDILTFQESYIDNVTEKARAIVYNADLVSDKKVSQTATYNNIQMENLYDVLYPFAKKFAGTWEFCVGMIAGYTDMKNNLVYSLYFSKDLKMKTTGELLIDLEQANRSGAGNEVRRTIQQDIMRNIYAEDNHQYVRYVTKEEYNPFSGMSSEEILFALGSTYTSTYNKVLYTNLGSIFDELESEFIQQNLNFYNLEKQKQQEAVRVKVQALIDAIKLDSPVPQLGM